MGERMAGLDFIRQWIEANYFSRRWYAWTSKGAVDKFRPVVLNEVGDIDKSMIPATLDALAVTGNMTVGGTLGVTGATSGSTASYTGAVAASSFAAMASGAMLRLSDTATNGYAKYRTGTVDVADSGEIALPDTVALLIIINWSDGKVGLFSIAYNYNACILVSDPGDAFSVTKDTASKINVYYDSASGGYTLQNKRGATKTIAVHIMGAAASF